MTRTGLYVRSAAGCVPALLFWTSLPFWGLADDGVPKSDATAAALGAMRLHARSIRLSEGGSIVPLREEPVLRYDDPARNIGDATVWAWRERGRPAAVVKIEHRADRPPAQRWLYALASLSPQPISVESADAPRWSAQKGGLDLQPIAKAAAPADSEAQRLRQMKQLAQRFDAYEFSGQHGRLQLRLMARPLYRYSDPAAGIQDGVIFAFAYGTNPDILLIVESQMRGGSPPAWVYGTARLGAGRMFVNCDGQEVWSERGTGMPARREVYMNWFEGG